MTGRKLSKHLTCVKLESQSKRTEYGTEKLFKEILTGKFSKSDQK